MHVSWFFFFKDAELHTCCYKWTLITGLRYSTIFVVRKESSVEIGLHIFLINKENDSEKVLSQSEYKLL